MDEIDALTEAPQELGRRAFNTAEFVMDAAGIDAAIGPALRESLLEALKVDQDLAELKEEGAAPILAIAVEPPVRADNSSLTIQVRFDFGSGPIPRQKITRILRETLDAELLTYKAA